MKINWFSGGNDRGNEALSIINTLLNDINNNPKDIPLQKVLYDYKDELEKRESSIHFILSRMNIAISNVVTKNGIVLSDNQSSKLSKLIKLSNIRYGY